MTRNLPALVCYRLPAPNKSKRADSTRRNVKARVARNNDRKTGSHQRTNEASLVVEGMFGGLGAREIGPLAGRPGPVVVSMPFTRQAQDASVIVRQHGGEIAGAQRCDRDRSCVVRIVLLRTAGAQRAHPRGARCWHIDNGFAGGDELLGEEVTEALGGLDRPRSVVSKTVGPVAQQHSLRRTGTDADLVDDGLEVIDRDGGVGCLVWVDPNGDGHDSGAFVSVMGPRWALLIRVDLIAPLSSHTPADGHRPVAVRYTANPAGGLHLESQPTGTNNATTTAATHPRLNQALFGRLAAQGSHANSSVRCCRSGQ